MPYYPDDFLFEFEAKRFAFSKHGFVRNGRGNRFTTFMVGTLLLRVLAKALSDKTLLKTCLNSKASKTNQSKADLGDKQDDDGQDDGEPAEAGAEGGEVNER